MTPATGSVTDQHARDRALDPQTSFIVQAPAGSGKTGLLVQRILILLTRVNDPEEIIAITFTRKAASEMRQRIIEALQSTADAAPEDPYKRHIWGLAQEVIKRDSQREWHLLSNPSRLRIHTIDALCASLVSQMPLLSRFGALPAVSEDAGELYRQAAIRTIEELETGASWSDSIGHLLAHLDNRMEYLQVLICNMLAKREQWLRHVADPQHPSIDRNSLEDALQRLVETILSALAAEWPVQLNVELMELLRFSISHRETVPASLSASLEKPQGAFPAFGLSDLPAWKDIACILLKADGGFRNSVSRAQGFPPQSAATTPSERELFISMKERMLTLLQRLQDFPQLVHKLHAVRQLPEVQYSEDEWQTLRALFELLRLSAAQLEVVFTETGLVDFTAISRAALQALGGVDEPTDIALALDYRISHILVDEFQDTSQSQFDLLKRLTAGWQQGDLRTLFLVGDPMQSIYRFREAEVGLFLEAWQYGLGSIVLEPLRLHVNFRSQQGIIEWVNNVFETTMPEQDDMETGAVSYVQSKACHPLLPGIACQIHPFFGQSGQQEARQVLEIIKSVRDQYPQTSIAILVRNRTHLSGIVAALRSNGVRFRAVEIESLSQRPVIQDLLALLKALSDAADKVAWLGVLRAPWCGLELPDLHRLSAYDHNKTILELINDDACVQALGATAQQRLGRIAGVLKQASENTYQRNVRDWIEGCWYRLGGPACLDTVTDLGDADVFFQLLEGLESTELADRNRELLKSVEKLFALPDIQADESLQIMTMHKSKGLEFDTVILPGLGYRSASDDSDLMKWFERPHKPGGNDLLMAPIRKTGAAINLKYQLLSDFDKQKTIYENGRLLYVACTRARRQLHLLGHVNFTHDETDFTEPTASTLLSSLWPVVSADFRQAFEALSQHSQNHAANPQTGKGIAQRFVRLAMNWTLPQAPPACMASVRDSEQLDPSLEFDWASETARHIGTVVHETLQYISVQENAAVSDTDMQQYHDRCRYRLVQLGVSSDEIDTASTRVMRAIRNCLSDPRGQWLLASAHRQARSEYALTGLVGQSTRRIVIDRTFVDDAGTRWIIDYKTGSHGGSGIEEFLDREVLRYRTQLEIYAGVMRRLDDRPIMLGLYFPLLQAWREWPYYD